MDYETPLFFHVMEYANRAAGDVIDMVSGNPDWEPPEALREGLRDYADLEPDRFQYAPSEGLLELREEIAARRGVDADQIVVTNGAGEANYLAMARALERDRGDEIVLTDPVYPYYPGKTTMLDGTQRFVATDDEGRLDPADVREAASEETAAIVVATPNNPTGAVYPESTMAALVDVAEEYDAILISDEVYDHYDLSGEFASALGVDSSHRIVTNAFSKSMAITGVRVGYAVFPPELVENAKTTRPASTSAGPDAPSLRARARRDLARRVHHASFYVMARFDGYPGTLENVERLIDEAGVAGMPGEAFGDSRSDWLRFALVTPRVEEAAERLAAYFD
ncbi:pyridoxal phosphate-dependent aminotransferase [Haloterrigena sp. SYSU A558-1]|uniref:Pyridoxal phosphate-dependent aminotransferase n=1 Tax=Haloterrigena gelatinilytica TaxID=2741724 RepID=A0ABX2LCB3_9EURY|nr:pyridoxal phosphate-dependent aminotransferase [Haloterrigena gelatinilytica]NUC71207.1 pyridoxal phosphate-dependent aminotransferase [Haloterrigena gelatinilytica]